MGWFPVLLARADMMIRSQYISTDLAPHTIIIIIGDRVQVRGPYIVGIQVSAMQGGFRTSHLEQRMIGIASAKLVALGETPTRDAQFCPISSATNPFTPVRPVHVST